MQQCSMALRCFPECKINVARKQEREKWKETGFPAIIPAIKHFISFLIVSESQGQTVAGWSQSVN